MSKKLAITIIALLLFACTNIGAGQLSIGVKPGDWIEYEITTIGAPMEGHNIIAARFEIIEVNDDGLIRANVTSTAQNGTVSTITRSFNFQDGQLEGFFLIPANLGAGDSFYDANSNQNITIQGEEQKTFLGATRVITSLDTVDRHKEWDKTTGVIVVTIDYLENYTIEANAVATNIWSPQILGLEPTVFYTIIAVIVIAVLAIALAAFFRKRSHMRHP